ncbi:hypothetical protein INS49_007738 [Diaporthe citri]|uniref:uncharacterized protein n=1 Tax=Diaporthe citri TaxID=83186 RepID=UPI001C801B22|nr:uncharacterized protein INS49_007738 [Diaporthe citri]KAG6362646.1 hypothetical protein INS49_007738 [Diaporthe citri]
MAADTALFIDLSRKLAEKLAVSSSAIHFRMGTTFLARDHVMFPWWLQTSRYCEQATGTNCQAKREDGYSPS